MAEYRLYVVDASGELHMPHEFEAADDDTAIALAAERLDGQQMELWEGGRKVRCWGFPECPYPRCVQEAPTSPQHGHL